MRQRTTAALSLFALLCLTGCTVSQAASAEPTATPVTIKPVSHFSLTPEEITRLDRAATKVKVDDKTLTLATSIVSSEEMIDPASKPQQGDHVRVALDTSRLAPQCMTPEDIGNDCVQEITFDAAERSALGVILSVDKITYDGVLQQGRSVIEFDAPHADIVHLTVGMKSGASSTFDALTGELISSKRPVRTSASPTPTAPTPAPAVAKD